MYRDKDYRPSQVVWEITLKCNLKCFHCGSAAGKKRENELTTKESLKVCKDLAEVGFKGIGLMGGELFLRKDWDLITKEIKDHGMAVSTVTNGYFCPDRIIPKLVKLEVDCVTVGFDGTEKIHDQIRGVKGSFKKALIFLREAKKAGLITNPITTVHKKNFKDIKNLEKIILQEEGLDWQIQEAVPIGRFSSDFALTQEEVYTLGLYIEYLQKKYSKDRVIGSHNLGFYSQKIPNLSFYPEWKGCYAGRSVLGIRSDGAVKGCEILPDEYIEGFANKRSIVDIWNDPNSFSYNRKFRKKDLGPLCIDCKHGEKCMGGCMCRSTVITKKPHNDPDCYYRIEKKLNL
jgi:radical SAM protein with 4Fe4S-binding SPASM domain